MDHGKRWPVGATSESLQGAFPRRRHDRGPKEPRGASEGLAQTCRGSGSRRAGIAHRRSARLEGRPRVRATRRPGRPQGQSARARRMR